MWRKRENRRQISRAFLERRDVYLKRKYDRFHTRLVSGQLPCQDSFPVTYEGALTLDEFTVEFSNSGFAHFIDAAACNPDKHYLDIGCGVRDVVFDNCLYLEVYPSMTADVIVPPTCRYPLRDQSFDGISCAAVLEHVTKPWEVVAEIHRLLKPGGRCYIDWPFLQPVHGFPSHFYNANRYGRKISSRSSGFEIIENIHRATRNSGLRDCLDNGKICLWDQGCGDTRRVSQYDC